MLVFCDYIDNMATSFKAPPLLSDESVYENWKREIEIWQAFTDLAPKKQGPAIFLTLQGKAREAALEIEIKDLTDDQGVKKLIEKLDSLYLEDINQSAYAAYESFEMYRRPEDMNIKEFFNNFERLYNKLKVYQMELPDGVLAYRVLKSANLSEENEKLARATITTLTYKSMTEQLKKIFTDISKSLSQQVNLKVEPTFHNENLGPDEEVNFVNQGRFQYKGKRSHSTYRGRNNRPWRHLQGRASISENWKDPQNRANIQERTQLRHTASNIGETMKKNPPNSFGQTSRCAICESICHWPAECPHNHEKQAKDAAEQADFELFSNAVQECYVEKLVGETLSCALLDSGCTKTVCGSFWLQCYKNSLDEKDQANIVYEPSIRTFKFGDSKVIKSTHKAYIPAYIGNRKVRIETEVVDKELLLPLSKRSHEESWNDDRFYK